MFHVAEVETVVTVSGHLVTKEMIPRESATLEEGKTMVLSSNVLLVTWCSWDLFS